MRDRRKIIIAAIFCSIYSLSNAACTDPPAPKVDWTNCVLENRLDLRGHNIKGAKFAGIKALFLNVSGMDLREVDFTGASLAFGNFKGVDARGVDFTDAVVYHADFTNADLKRAVFTRVEMGTVKISGAQLTDVKWTDGSKGCAAGSVGVCR